MDPFCSLRTRWEHPRNGPVVDVCYWTLFELFGLTQCGECCVSRTSPGGKSSPSHPLTATRVVRHLAKHDVFM